MKTRIKELRKEKKITQIQLSLELGVTQETISAYEHGRHLPSVAALIKMSEIFGCSMDYIMGLSSERSLLRGDGSNVLDSQKDFLLNCYRRLGSRNKSRLLAYAEGLLDAQKE